MASPICFPAAVARWLGQAEEVTPPGLKKPVWRWTHIPEATAATAEAPAGGDSAAAAATAGALPNTAASLEGPATCLPGGNSEAEAEQGTSRLRSACVSHLDAHRLLSCCALNEDYYDLVDVDSFGSDSSFLGAAIESVK